MVLRDGILLYAQPGALPERALDQLRHDHGLLVVGIICWAKVTSAALWVADPRAGLPVAAAAGVVAPAVGSGSGCWRSLRAAGRRQRRRAR
jgi:hypothetical protein